MWTAVTIDNVHSDCRNFTYLAHFISVFPKKLPIRGFDAGLANGPFLVFDFRALWRSGLREKSSRE